MADDPNARSAIVKTDPDPSQATRELVHDTIANLREFIDVKDEVTRARLDAMDKAVAIIAAFPTAIDNSVTALKQIHDEKFLASDRARDLNIVAINERINKTDAVSDQRFLRIDAGFTERDKRTDALSIAGATAIAAALQAQKEAAGETAKSSSLAIDKSERATIESIKSLQTLFQTAIAAITANMQDLKSRLDKGEGSSSIADPATARALQDMSLAITRLSTGANRNEGATAAKSDSTAWIFSIVAIGLAVGTMIVDIFWLHAANVK